MHWLCAWPLYGWMLLGAPCSNRRRSAAPMTLQASGTLRSSPFCSVITNRLFGAGDLVSRIPPATSAAITMAVPPQVTSLRLDRRRRAAATLLRRGFLPGRPGRPRRPAGRTQRLDAAWHRPRRQVGLGVGRIVEAVEHLPAGLAGLLRGPRPARTTGVVRLARRVALLSHGAPP